MEYFGKGYLLSTVVFYAGFYVMKKYFWHPKKIKEEDKDYKKEKENMREDYWGQFVDIEKY